MVWFMMLYRVDRFYWWSTLRKPPTCRKSLTNLITLRCIEYTYPWRDWVPKLVLIGGLVTLLLPVFLCLIFSLGWAEYHKRSLLHKYTLCLLYYIRNGNHPTSSKIQVNGQIFCRSCLRENVISFGLFWK
jgi:hypothetical protein